MGCSAQRDKLLHEEQIIFDHEKKLNYKSAEMADFVLRKYSFNDTVNRPQLEQAARELGLNLQSNFYDSLFYLGETSLKKLLILGIFLGGGENSQKALLLFQVYDTQNSYEISDSDLLDLFNSASEIFLRSIRFLIDSSKHSGIFNYLERCCSMKDDGNRALVRRLLKEELSVTRDEFCSFFENKKLFTSSGLRSFYYKLYLSQKSESSYKS